MISKNAHFVFCMIISIFFSFSSLQAMRDPVHDQQLQDRKERLARLRTNLCVRLCDEMAYKKKLGFNVFDYIFQDKCSVNNPHPSIEEIKKLYKARNIALPCSRENYQELLNEEEELYGLRKDAAFFAPIVQQDPTAMCDPIIKPIARRHTSIQTDVSNPSLLRAHPLNLHLNPHRGERIRFTIRRSRDGRHNIQINPRYQPLEVVSLP